MSYWIAGAAIGSALIGAYSSDKASDKAASAAKAGTAASNALANQARTDAINLFSRGLTSSNAGTGAALKFYQNNAKAKIQPYVRGNVAAQQVLGQGATQQQNAILGLPVDMTYANNPISLGADYSGIESAKIPTLGKTFAQEEQTRIDQETAKVAAAQAQAAKAKEEDIGSARYILDPLNQVNNVKNLINKIW